MKSMNVIIKTRRRTQALFFMRPPAKQVLPTATDKAHWVFQFFPAWRIHELVLDLQPDEIKYQLF